MKNIVIVFLILLCSCNSNAQDILNFGWYGDDFDFEDSAEYNHVLLDTSGIWQITHPKKNILRLYNDHYWGDKAIVTDTNLYYPINCEASFQFKLFIDPGTSGYYLGFVHMYDFNKNIDGGIIESSWDYGATWKNIVFDSLFCNSTNMYTVDDTIQAFNNQPGFTGLNKSCKFVNFHTSPPSSIDTLLLRFTFKSSDVQCRNEGWLLDYFTFSGYLEDVQIDNYKERIHIYPNPANDRITVEAKNEMVHHISICTIGGYTVKECNNCNAIDVRDVNSGLYFIKVNNTFYCELIIE